MRIGDVSERLGIPASTIRYYEKVGLIERQLRVSGRRAFDSHALQSLEFIQLAQTAGFSITETKTLLASYANNPSRSGVWQQMALSQMEKVHTQIKDLKQMEKVLDQMLSCQCQTVVDCLAKAKKSDRPN